MTIDILSAMACTAAVTALLCKWEKARLAIAIVCILISSVLLFL